MEVIPSSNATITPPSPQINQVSFGSSIESGGRTESFSDLVRGLLEQVNAPQVEADQALTQLISGDTDNIHNVVMSVAKADMSFRFMLELRNRLTEAYQEVMRMQV